ncbi:hypothetical protein ACFFQW_28010 [Umezawaea endophytica]|uniref:Esterase-like activity of phytase family protein n=1 Tax=Umezawaea endophytica TaxID=1654476 RepID=A0A9X2VH46_9PSEU|nr:hypothetical protein [Umezawaea endophytica]MCS7476585.1 hypothetical protein [Umezawaea endophytica]
MRLLALVGVLTIVTAGSATADPAAPVPLCTVTDQRLEELSGLASDGDRLYAVNDSDNGTIAVQVIGRDCEIQDTITAPVNPFDVEDLALGQDGRLWLADTGDNGKSRETVGLHAVSQDGTSELFRLTYPDGKHDAEALLLDQQGIPYIITKETLGSALVYRPTAPLVPGTTAPLEQVARVYIKGTDTPGGPLKSSVVTRVVTGGAVSHDGKVLALRTYTDAYLFPITDGDLVKALDAEPVQIPLPNEEQGEAITFDPDGTLLSASEFGKSTESTITTITGAAALATPAPPSTTAQPAQTGDNASAAPLPTQEKTELWPAIALGTAALVLIAASVRRSRRKA